MNTRTNITIAVVAVLLIGLGVIAYSKQGYQAPKPPRDYTATTTDMTAATSTSSLAIYTMADVAKHNDSTSCWSAINGKVYTLTAWISLHPGGQEAILGLCGKDGTAAFNAQHGGQAQPAAELASFYLGDIKK